MAFLSSSARRCTAILVTVLVRRSAKDMTGWVCAHGLCTSTCRDTVGSSMCLQVCGARFLSKTMYVLAATAIGMHAMHMTKHGFRIELLYERTPCIIPARSAHRQWCNGHHQLKPHRCPSSGPPRICHGTAVGAKTQVSTMTSTVKYMSLSLPSLLRRLQEALKVSRLLSHSPASFAACRRLSKSPDSSASLRKLLFEVVSSRSGESNSCTLPPPRSRIRS